MGQRNMVCTLQMLDLESEPSSRQLHPERHILQGNILDHPSQNINLALFASGNAEDLDCHQFTDHLTRSMYHGNQYNNTQFSHPVPNLDVGVVAQTNFYHPWVLPSSSPIPQHTGSANHLPPFINHQAIGINMDEYGRSNHFSQCVRGSCKRKNTEAIPGNFYYANGSASSSLSSTHLSQNSGQTHWEEPYGSDVNLLDSTTFNPPDYQVGRTLPSLEGSFRCVRNRSSSISFPPEFPFLHHLNYLLPGNHLGPSFHLASNAWLAQVVNNISDGGCSNWSYSYTMPSLHGRSVSSGAVEMANIRVQGYQEISSSLHPASLPYFQQHPQPAQNIQVQNHSYHARMLAPPYQHPLSNMQPDNPNPNPSSNNLHPGSGFPFLPSNAELIQRPSRQLIQATPEVSRENVRILTSEDPAFVELTELFGARNVIDDHRDLRLDIDGMSYEELLALEEQIGSVSTGLTEEFILKNLRTIIHVPRKSSLANQSLGFAPENEACIICQVGYEEKERIGILDCGHNYHADCIKQWLLVKNLCPICKASAWTTDKIDG